MAVSQRLIDQLNDLRQLDHEAAEAYQQAIDRVTSDQVRAHLLEFQGDHRRHLEALTQLVVSFGGKPTARGEMKRYFLKGLTALRAMGGDEQALRALRLTARHQTPMELRELPDDVRHLLQRRTDDLTRHLAWIERALDERLWEQDAGLPL